MTDLNRFRSFYHSHSYRDSYDKCYHVYHVCFDNKRFSVGTKHKHRIERIKNDKYILEFYDAFEHDDDFKFRICDVLLIDDENCNVEIIRKETWASGMLYKYLFGHKEDYINMLYAKISYLSLDESTELLTELRTNILYVHFARNTKIKLTIKKIEERINELEKE